MARVRDPGNESRGHSIFETTPGFQQALSRTTDSPLQQPILNSPVSRWQYRARACGSSTILRMLVLARTRGCLGTDHVTDACAS